MIRRGALSGIFWFCFCASALAYQGYGDIKQLALAFYGLRAYSSGYANASGKLVNLSRASDGHLCDLLTQPTGGPGVTANCGQPPDNNQSLAAFCNATTCTIQTFYDQTGNSNNEIFNGTGAAVTISCVNGVPCAVGNGTSTAYLSTTFAGSGSPVTWIWVADRTGNFTAFNAIWNGTLDAVNFSASGYNNAANQIEMADAPGGTICTASASDSAWHVIQAAHNFTSSRFNVDGAETTPTCGNNGFGNRVALLATTSQAQNFSGNFAEAALYAGTLTQCQRIGICINASTYYGITATCGMPCAAVPAAPQVEIHE